MKRISILLPAVLFLAACGGYSSSSSTSKPATGSVIKTISVSEKEYSITPGSIHVSKTGTYSFAVKNNGTIGHAFEVEGQGIEVKTGTIDPASSAVLKVKLAKSGSYEVYCPIDGHKSQGMKGSLTVGASAAGGGMTTTGQTTTTNSYTPGY